MNIYRLDEMATKGSDSSKYQSTTCSLLDLSSLAITTSVIVPTPYKYPLYQSTSWLPLHSTAAQLQSPLCTPLYLDSDYFSVSVLDP
jgi:hypothetical protein